MSEADDAEAAFSEDPENREPVMMCEWHEWVGETVIATRTVGWDNTPLCVACADRHARGLGPNLVKGDELRKASQMVRAYMMEDPEDLEMSQAFPSLRIEVEGKALLILKDIETIRTALFSDEPDDEVIEYRKQALQALIRIAEDIDVLMKEHDDR